MSAHAEPPLVSGQLDRDAATRLNEEALDEAWRDPRATLLRLRDGQVPLRDRDEHTELDLLPVAGSRGPAHYYLGRAEGAPVFAKNASKDDPSAGTYSEPQGGWHHPFLAGEKLRPVQRELMAVAYALVNWHGSAAFSPRDASPTQPVQGGWARVDETGAEHFPRTDPAVIVIIEHEDRLLLGSNVLWESGRFSLLAGFVEAGESAEQAVVREIYEEAGIAVDGVQYVASQSWPFPRSLMLGFRVRLAAGQDPESLSPDPSEISELRWFTREELLRPAPESAFKLPGKLSIARWLIDLWIAEGDSGR